MDGLRKPIKKIIVDEKISLMIQYDPEKHRAMSAQEEEIVLNSIVASSKNAPFKDVAENLGFIFIVDMPCVCADPIRHNKRCGWVAPREE